ncbi:MAG: Holliday junction resolvase RuvX [Anaerolineales bacterium]|nr:Holliday junction resolvase RuvX [Anaerolineales bacterium]
MTRILAVDPGDVRIGLAVSDPTGTIARPLDVLQHVSRQKDAEAILQIAHELEVEVILVGVALDREGEMGPQARKAMRLVHALRAITDLQVATWDETDTTLTAQLLERRSRAKLDSLSAAIILQEFLDAKKH